MPESPTVSQPPPSPPPPPSLKMPPQPMYTNEQVSPVLRPYWSQEPHPRSQSAASHASPYSRIDGMPSPNPGLVGLPSSGNNGRYSPAMPHHGHQRSTRGSHSSPTLDLTGLITMHDSSSQGPMGRPHPDANHYRSSDEWLPTHQHAQHSSFHGASGPSHRMWPVGGASLYEDKWPRYTPGHRSPSSPYSTPSDSASPSAYFLSPMSTTTPLPPHPPQLPNNNNPNPTPTGRGRGGQPLVKKECFHCHATSTPLWRREPTTQRPLCNACGLYLQQRNKLRPQELIDADRDDTEDEINRIPDAEYTGPKCSHCATRQTSVWRRSKTGQQVCNACGVYARLKGKERPLSLRRNKIKPRTKHTR
ncbi:hypothetical protein C8F01DRAFT_1175679 [Mycena amicta]|nr:hypothetical protein C8F01DRAFT_1175679 [Mycena amicta]